MPVRFRLRALESRALPTRPACGNAGSATRGTRRLAPGISRGYDDAIYTRKFAVVPHDMKRKALSVTCLTAKVICIRC